MITYRTLSGNLVRPNTDGSADLLDRDGARITGLSVDTFAHLCRIGDLVGVSWTSPNGVVHGLDSRGRCVTCGRNHDEELGFCDYCGADGVALSSVRDRADEAVGFCTDCAD